MTTPIAIEYAKTDEEAIHELAEILDEVMATPAGHVVETSSVLSIESVLRAPHVNKLSASAARRIAMMVVSAFVNEYNARRRAVEATDKLFTTLT